MTDMQTNKIYNIDCIEGMRLLPNNSIDLTVTSPPYDNLRTYNGNIDQWSFDKFKFNLHDTMIYQKNNPVPQADKTRYTQCFEYMFVFSKGKPKTVNRIMTECQHIGKVHFGKNKLNNENCDRKVDRAVKPTKPLTNIWAYNVGINQSSKDKIASGVPAIFPEQLAQDHILSWSNEGDVVLDCFMGSGTTAKMALLNNRKYIGFEISKEYCEIANERVKIYDR